MFDIEYQFNFCDTIPKKCNGVEASAIEFLDIYDTATDTCEVLGQSHDEKMIYALIDDKKAEKGLFVSFMGGETCQGSLTKELNGLPRKVVFRMECAETQDKEVSVFISPNH